MRTRDAVRDEVAAAHLAIEAGGDCCPTPPLTDERQGWKDGPIVCPRGPADLARRTRYWQQGALARVIWESLPDEHRWWLHGGRRPG